MLCVLLRVAADDTVTPPGGRPIPVPAVEPTALRMYCIPMLVVDFIQSVSWNVPVAP